MKKTVLIVDDNNDILEVLKIILEEEGYNVMTCNQGGYAESIIRKAQGLLDVVILDVFLSGSDGRDIVYRVKQTDATKRIPIIMFSAQPNIRATAFHAGADEFLPKPFQMNDLLDTVHKYTN